MKKISSSSVLSIISKLLIILVITKSISLGLWWYLPNESVELQIKNNFIQSYKRINFSNMIKQDKVKPKIVDSKPSSSEVSITNMILKGLYGTKNKGYIIVAMKSNVKKTSIVGIGEVFQGYTLKSLTRDSAVFVKNSKNYILALKKMKKSKYIKPVKKSRSNKKLIPGIPNIVSKKDITYYSKNPKQIWKDISISEVKDGKKIKGFKVNRIKRGSRFANLGIKQGDLIIKANNVRLESYRDAMNIYKNISKLDAIEIVVLRNNQEVELVYEID